MARNAIGVIVGLVVAFLVVAGIQSINYILYPIPDNIDQTDVDAMKTYVSTLPSLAFIVVIISHFLGATVAGFVGSKIADSHQRKISIGLGVFLLSMGMINMFSIPHPVWFVILDFIVYIPGALFGYAIYKR